LAAKQLIRHRHANPIWDGMLNYTDWGLR